jgi:hypothetical protein
MSINSEPDRLTSRVIELIRCEMQKEEIRQKLKCVAEPIISHITKSFIPYIAIILIIFILVLICQCYLVYKLCFVQKLSLTN